MKPTFVILTILLFFEIGFSVLLLERGFLDSSYTLSFQMLDVICLGILIPLSSMSVPFPFTRKLPILSYIILTGLRLCAHLLVSIILILLGFTPYFRIYALNPMTFSLAVNAGVGEESFIVCVTNLVPMLIAKITRSQSNRVTVCAGGILAVVVWTTSHVLTVEYNAVSIVALFIVGMVGFVLVYWKGNYGPLILAHSIWDLTVTTNIVQLLLRFFI